MSAAAFTALADRHSWVAGNNVYFSAADNWYVAGVGYVAPVAGDELAFWRDAATAGSWLYVTNDLSVSFGTVNFSSGLMDVAGNLSLQSSKQLRVATSPSSPLAVVNKRSGNWTIGQDVFIGGTDNGHDGVTGIFTNKLGNITAANGWIYVGGNINGGELINTTGTLVNVSGTISTKAMIIGGAANGTRGRLEVLGGKVSLTSYDKIYGSVWSAVYMDGWGGARGEIYVAKGATLESTANGANITFGDGVTEIKIDGTVRLNNGDIGTSNNSSPNKCEVWLGPAGRLECREVLGSSASGGYKRLYLDGGTRVNTINGKAVAGYFSIMVTDLGGTVEVPSGLSAFTGAWFQNAAGSSRGTIVKTGAGSLSVNNVFRPGGGLHVKQGSVQIEHKGSFTSYDIPLKLSGTASVTSGALVFGSGSSLSFDCASKTSKPTMTVSTSFTRSAEVPITFNTAEPFAFDDSYTLISGGKITSTNNFKVASATADGTDITQGVYLAVESGNLVLKRKPYFMIKVR